MWYCKSIVLLFLQDELDEVVRTWNSHTIRPSSSGLTVSGRPIVMHSFPELHSAEDRLKPVSMLEVAVCEEECTPKGQFPCDETIFELCCLVMEENGWDAPADPLAAADLYVMLREEILQNIWKMHPGLVCLCWFEHNSWHWNTENLVTAKISLTGSVKASLNCI